MGLRDGLQLLAAQFEFRAGNRELRLQARLVVVPALADLTVAQQDGRRGEGHHRPVARALGQSHRRAAAA